MSWALFFGAATRQLAQTLPSFTSTIMTSYVAATAIQSISTILNPLSAKHCCIKHVSSGEIISCNFCFSFCCYKNARQVVRKITPVDCHSGTISVPNFSVSVYIILRWNVTAVHVILEWVYSLE